MAVASDSYTNPVAQMGTEQYDKNAVENEHIRYLNETKKLDKKAAKKAKKEKTVVEVQDDFSKAGVNKAAEKSANLIEARMLYDAGVENTDLEIEFLKFTEHSDAQKTEYAEYKRRRAKILQSVKKAKKLEKKATKRYYNTLCKEAENPSVIRNPKRKARLEEVVSKLEGLYRERESLDARLANLYKGAESRSGGKIRLKAENKRYKMARRVHRNLKPADCRLEKMNIPGSLKVKIRYLYNTKIVSKSTITYSKYLLKKLKPKGDARAELKRNIKKAEKSLALLEVNLKKLTKKARSLNEKRIARRRFLKFFLFLVVVAAIAGAVYMLGLGK
jgi:hypothetical protein